MSRAGWPPTGEILKPEWTPKNLMEDIINRLKRIEGQIRGLQKMIEREEDCDKFLTQLVAAKAALEQTGMLIVTNNMKKCFNDTLPDNAAKSREFDDSLSTFMKHLGSLKS